MRNAFLAAGMMLCLGVGQGLRASQLVPQNLVDLTQSAARIFDGEVVRIEYGTVPSKGGKLAIPMVRYIFRVNDALKGKLDSELVIQQLSRPRDGSEFVVDPSWLNIPEYKVGARYLLFMWRDGSTGLTSPMGAGQGVFTVDKNSAKQAVGEEFAFVGLEKALADSRFEPLLQHSKRAKDSSYDLDLLKGLVRDLVAGKVKAPTYKEATR